MAVLIAAAGGAAVQAYRVRLDRRSVRAAAKARLYRRIRATLRRWPDGPPLAAGAEAPSLAGFLDDLAALTEDVAAAWPSDGLAYTLERLMDAVLRLPGSPNARPATLNLYRICSEHLVVLDLGLLGARGLRPLALPVVGAALRIARELRARAALGRALPPWPHGLPPLASAAAPRPLEGAGPAPDMSAQDDGPAAHDRCR